MTISNHSKLTINRFLRDEIKANVVIKLFENSRDPRAVDEQILRLHDENSWVHAKYLKHLVDAIRLEREDVDMLVLFDDFLNKLIDDINFARCDTIFRINKNICLH